MSQILKCPNMRVVLSYWEALIEGSELRYESLLYFSSNGSYCIPLREEKCVECIKKQRIEQISSNRALQRW